MRVRSIADCDPSCGGKANGLARLVAAQLPVPECFVIGDDVFRDVVGVLTADVDSIGHQLGEAARQIDAALPDPEIVARAAALGGRLAVRSSASIEDGAAGAAAGVFSSVTDVAASEVWPAVRAVWSSALAPLAANYARRRGAEPAVAVIVQRFIAGEPITVYTRPPGAPDRDEVWVQRNATIAKFRRADRDPIVALAMRAEQAIAAIGGADVELVLADTLWVVQARPISHPPVRANPVPPPHALLAPLLVDGRRWTWDVAHNPDPLSPAQVGLVERVESAGVAPWSLRVSAGYLYTAPRVEVSLPSVADRADLDAQAAVHEAELARILEGDAASLDDALARYLAFYRVWAKQLHPLISAARRVKPRRRSTLTLRGARTSAVEMTLLAAARGELVEQDVIARLGVLSPAWDVAVPTFAERPGVLRDSIARARQTLLSCPAPEPAPEVVYEGATDEVTKAMLLSRGAAELAERDDFWFARAQWMMRRAILARAGECGIDPEDACWIPLDELIRGMSAFDARRHAAAERAAAERAMGWQMPLVVEAGRAIEPELGPALTGVGTGSRVTGRVVRFASLASAIAVGHGEIVVTRAVTPALAVMVVGCAAIVSETGGPLDHGAALARELGVPCVVGCRDAWTRLSDGMIVTVDGNAGQVTIASDS
jgi:phosphohistidine swiveling domain-containing protein